MSVFVAKSPVISPMPGNCRTRASVTATQPPQDQPPMLNPALVVIVVGVVAAGSSWDGSIGGVDVGDIGGEGWQADMITAIISPTIMVE